MKRFLLIVVIVGAVIVYAPVIALCYMALFGQSITEGQATGAVALGGLGGIGLIVITFIRSEIDN